MILHVITNFAARAGAETMLARLVSSDAQEPTIIVSLMDISEHNRTLASGSNVRFIALNAKSPVSLVPAISKLVGLIDGERPDVLVCWMYHAMIAGTLASRFSDRRPQVYWNIRQSLDDPQSLSRSSQMAILLCRSLSRRADGLIYNSSRALKLHGDYGFDNTNAVVIPNGFDLAPTAGARHRRRSRIGIAARFHPQKDHITFFRAASCVAATHPYATFIAAGRGLTWENKAVVALLSNAGLARDRLELLGEVGKMTNFYEDIDFLVLSSRTEGFPNVLAEAMSHGRPVVTTDVGDAAIVVGQAGLVVPARNPDALAMAIRTLLDVDDEAFLRLSENARRHIEENYELSAVVGQYRKYLKDRTQPAFDLAETVN